MNSVKMREKKSWQPAGLMVQVLEHHFKNKALLVTFSSLPLQVKYFPEEGMEEKMTCSYCLCSVILCPLIIAV